MTRLLRAAAAAACVLALAPATAAADIITFGSSLAAPADVALARQADTIYFQSVFPDGRGTTVPASGQIKTVSVKGFAPYPPVPGQIGGETMFHIQTLKPLPDGTYQVLVTSQPFFVPNSGASDTITTFLPINLCAAAGDVVVFNTIGGWSGTADPPFNFGTPLQIFSRQNGTISEYTKDNGTNNGAIVRPIANPGHELLMQLTVGTGQDGTGLCPGGTFTGVPAPPPPPGGPPPPPGSPPPPPPPPPPPAAAVQKATIGTQRVTVSRTGKLVVSLFCRTGPSRCVGTVRPKSRARTPTTLGSGTFAIASGKTGRSTVQLNRIGRKRLAARGGRLPVNIVAETRPGGPTRRSTLAVTLRRRST